MSETTTRRGNTKEDGQKQSRRRISHISKACNGCRRRKMKCDGAQPSCAICKVYKEECVYNPEADGRRSTPKAYVAALEERVRVLEGMLKTAGLEAGAGEAKPEPPENETTPETAGLDRLKIDETTGELFEYGPTSLFKHVPEGSDDASPAATLGPSPMGAPPAVGAERPALLRPREILIADLNCPELDDSTHEKVLRLFFDYFNPQSFWVDERKFRRDLASSPVVDGTIIRARRTAHYSPLLHNVILALGVAFLEIPVNVREQLGIAFSKRAKDLLEEEAETAMISTVSGVLLLGSYHASVARHNLGFMYSGIGLRLVQALGLGTNCNYWVTNGSITEETKQSRYNMWYCAYILDKCWSTYVGRSAALPLAQHDIPVPTPDAEEDELIWHPIIHTPRSETFDPEVGQDALDLSDAIATANAEPVKGWRSTTFVWMIKLSIIAERVLSTVYSINFNIRSSNVRHVVSELDVILEKWLDSIPDELRLPTAGRSERIVPGHILSLHAFHCFILILLHRPWFANCSPTTLDSGPDGSVAKCERAAAKFMTILQTWRRCPGLRYSPVTLGQVAFSAGTVHLLSASHCPTKQSRKFKAYIENVQTCIAALREMGETLKCAAVSADTLQKLLDESYAPALPKPAPAHVPTPSAGFDIATMLQNPAFADQLKQLGWAPPTANGSSSGQALSSGTGGSSASTPSAPMNGANANGSAIDWSVFGQLHPLNNMPMNSANQGAGEQGQNIYDVLYAGASETPFPAGNVWAWTGFGPSA
ncbi:hypothetical protein CspeluHIS016_0306850 [Cutaneotrichosporon spelunceum]|uniref:Zn(2)-C6 fungal-type domain-containing protein n=1 Tax=Cutaneotrichosporon spelunceum TaxID=1672016 RepID=A0AAD3TUR8_9TREE|nr:hypothetical protein CspeluHIS016_0306850 [Cutaneotrichosporon spelunceum]